MAEPATPTPTPKAKAKVSKARRILLYGMFAFYCLSLSSAAFAASFTKPPQYAEACYWMAWAILMHVMADGWKEV
jgi:hypothetical protein